MKHKSILLGAVLAAVMLLSISGLAFVANAADTLPNSKNGDVGEQTCLAPGGKTDSQLEFWKVDEFESWMEQQHEENQRLADSHDKSFYGKGANGDYYCREWTQADVDALYNQWQEQLSLMEQGYHFTKEITLPDGGFLAGAFDPETWNAKSGVSPGSTIITMPDKSTVDLGHFDTAAEARRAVEQYLTQQVKDGLLTQAEADKILANGATE